jgi:hypothetical protein
MALQFHSIVQDTSDFDRSLCRYPIHKEVPSAPAMSSNVEGTEASRDLVPGFGPGNVGTVGKLADRQKQRVPIESRLTRAETLNCPPDDVGEIELRGGTKPNAPIPLGHEASYSAAAEMTFSESLVR